MADYSREIVQALREIAVEMKGIRAELRGVKHAMQGLDRRLATSGGLTNALTRRAHIVIDRKTDSFFCSACGELYSIIPTSVVSIDEVAKEFAGRDCRGCGARFDSEAVES